MSPRVDCVAELGAVFYRIRGGCGIGSAALVADGVHARTDSFTSLASWPALRRSRRPRRAAGGFLRRGALSRHEALIR